MASNQSPGSPPLWSLRLPLATLQLFLAILIGYYGGGYPSSLSDLSMESHSALIVSLGLLVFTTFLPSSMIQKGWVIAFFTAANATLLVKLTVDAGAVEPWLYLGYVLVTLMASLSPSTIQFTGLSTIVCTVYALSVYRYGSPFAEEILLIPVLVALVMVYAMQAKVAQYDVEKSAESEDKARSESMVDALTGLPNRAQFVDRVWRAIHCAQNNREFMFAVLFVDLDGFKPINDGLGHKAGDAVLVEMARRLQSCLRKGDIVARYGGDEFTLLVNNVNGKADAIRVADRVLRKVKEPFQVGKRVHVGASIGIALNTNFHERPEDLIRDADHAMYKAKSQGKGTFEVSDKLRDLDVPAGAVIRVRS